MSAKEETAIPVDERGFDRELSWLEFNARVLAEAIDSDNPLLERLKFAGIVSSNFDEFYMVRAASLNEEDPHYTEIYEKGFRIMGQQHEFFTNALAFELDKAGIQRRYPQGLTDEELGYLKRFWDEELSPLLTPIALRDEAELPHLNNLTLYQIVELMESDSPLSKKFAVIEIPKKLSRTVTLPSLEGYRYMLIEDILTLFTRDLFDGYEVIDQGTFRITRGAELTFDEEKDADFARVMSDALRNRRKSEMTRFEVIASQEIVEFLKTRLEIPEARVFRTEKWLDLKSISGLAFQPMFPELKLPKWTPRPVPEFETDDPWSMLRKKDVMSHHPYESFDAYLHVLSAAADDPDVLAIKQTLYRAAQPSMVVRHLERAAANGKQVTVLVELKARFDEEQNIGWAERLVNAGATVLYGIAGLKTHAKACLIVRREPEGIRRYAHLSTGNYNEKTAGIYSDIGLFTSQEDITADIASFFNVITGYSQPSGFRKIEIAPFGLRRKLERLILREALRSQKSKPGLIMAKMNSLVDPQIIEALYRASQAGVKVKLNIRGICCLRPGVPGLSENIEVVSIVDMFLEHSRIFYFENDGEAEVFLSSADWMPRNLDKRIELLFPVEDASIRKELTELLQLYFKDTQRSWRLAPDGSYTRKKKEEKGLRVQKHLCKQAKSQTARGKSPLLKELKPQRPKPRPS